MVSVKNKLRIPLCISDSVILDRLEQERQSFLSKRPVHLNDAHSFELLE